MPELRQFANIVQLNESREQLAMLRDDHNAGVRNAATLLKLTLKAISHT
jgi:hypothetical protein